MRMKCFYLFLLAGVIFFGSSRASTGLYIWVDENGVKHYSDTAPVADSKESKTAVKTLEASKDHETIIFHIKDAPNPAFLGKYLPVCPTQRGYPRYEKEIDKLNGNDIKVQMEVVGISGKWMWRIEGARTKYFSVHVPEGTPPDNIASWRDFSPSGDKVRLQIISEIVVTAQEYREYSYAFGLTEGSAHFKPWMKDVYNVSGHPDMGANGIYHAVQWSSLLPKYRNANGYCMKADDFSNSWEWHIGKCDEYAFSADPEPAGTPPEKVKRWYERAGMLYTSFKIEKVAKSR